MTHSNINEATAKIRVLSGFQGWQFDPAQLIRAVNHCHQLGHDGSLVALRTTLERSDSGGQDTAEKVLLVARVLYTPKGGNLSLPSLQRGQAEPSEPSDQTLAPLFPVHIIEDIPFLLIAGYRLAGQAPPAGDYLAWCEHEGILRSNPISPGPEPLSAADKIINSEVASTLAHDQTWDHMLRLQALRMVARICKAVGGMDGDLAAQVRTAEAWSQLKQQCEGTPLRWDGVRDRYEPVDAR